MKSILYGVTADVSLVFYAGHASALRAAGFEVAFLSGSGPFVQQFADAERVTVFEVAMKREPSLVADLGALLRVLRVILRVRPLLTNFGTPKAGLLGNVAAFLCRVPHRVYTLHGLRLETETGWRRRILATCERIACGCATAVVCVSPSLRERAIELRLVRAEKAIVLGKGTCNGIEVSRFAPVAANLARAEPLRKTLGLSPSVPVMGFVGRFTRDKGMREIHEVFRVLRRERPHLRLLLVGDFEKGDAVAEGVRAAMERDPGIVRTGWAADASPYYHLMDVVLLPTHREGFSLVSLEAQAAGIPVVVTRATGIVNSVREGRSGWTVPVGDVPAMVKAIRTLLDNPGLRSQMGGVGQEWVGREFTGHRVRAALIGEYQRWLRGTAEPKARPTPQAGWGGVAKRIFDLTILGLSWPLVLPLLAILALLLRLSTGGPVLFRQQRPGQHGRPFMLVKFRTMTQDRDADGRLLPDAQRLTRLGRFLRTASLDELPELWNVFTGTMTLVGPRPLLMEYLDSYTPEQARRHQVLPGITGWAQIHGRNAIGWKEKFALDTWYVDHWSLALDLRILLATVWRVLGREHVSHAGHATMPYFISGRAESDCE
jgi:lipopolysaccharide/colanic/teichoic acid biosynthesis glycosyltransferase